MTRTPRWYQLECLNALLDYFFKGRTGNPVAALPTGTGKSFIIALFVQYILQRWPRQRILVLTHVKELIVQNAKTFLEYWPEAPVGIYSAGLNQRDAMMPVVFGGCASVVNAIAQIGWRDCLIIDEAHLVSQKEASIYHTIIAELRKINPHLKVIGLTATPYRLGQGLITDDGMFTDIVYDLTTPDAFMRLINEGFLAPIFPYRPSVEIDSSNISIVSGGEFNKTEAEAEADKITVQACWETARCGQNKRSWLIFAQGVKHAEHICTVMNQLGIPTTVVHNKIKDRDQRLKDYQAGKYRCMVNYGVFTTGFDHPMLDLIAILRLTNSPSLWVQILGRGTRPFFAPGYDIDTLEGRLAAIAAGSKPYGCLVLDFAGNTARLGPINDPVLPKKRGIKTTPGVMPCKICEACGCYNHTRATHCAACGAAFDMRPKITAEASQQELMRLTTEPIVTDFNVTHVLYTQGRSYSSPEVYFCISYFVGTDKIDERWYLENKYTSGKEARKLWQQRYMGDGSQLRPASFAGYTPASVSEALNLTQMLRVPTRIRVQNDGRHKTVIGHFWT